MYNVIEELKVITSLIFLLYTSALDIKYREVDLKVWFVFGSMAVTLTLAEFVVFNMSLNDILKLAASALFALSIGGLAYYLDLFGGADLFALITLAIMHPWHPFKPLFGLKPPLPFILTVLVNSLISSLIIPLMNIARNLSHLGLVFKLRIPKRYKIAYMFLGFPVTIEKYLGMKFTYPLIIYRVAQNGKLETTYRLSFSIEEEHYEHQDELRKLVERGLLSYGDVIWVTQGIPLLVFITFGYVVSLIFGDVILCLLFTYILKVPAC